MFPRQDCTAGSIYTESVFRPKKGKKIGVYMGFNIYEHKKDGRSFYHGMAYMHHVNKGIDQLFQPGHWSIADRAFLKTGLFSTGAMAIYTGFGATAVWFAEPTLRKKALIGAVGLTIAEFAGDLVVLAVAHELFKLFQATMKVETMYYSCLPELFRAIEEMERGTSDYYKQRGIVRAFDGIDAAKKGIKGAIKLPR